MNTIDSELALRLISDIRRQSTRPIRLMEFCGGHTHAISRYGLQDLLPANVHMIHGPGCPVCVLPIGRIDMAIELAMGTLTPDPSPKGEGRKVLPSPLGEGLGMRVGGEGLEQQPRDALRPLLPVHLVREGRQM